MRFSENGPEFPAELIDQLIAGEVVFLCGAGVSAPQLPGFQKLVDDIYEKLGEKRTAGEDAAYSEQRFEECLGSLSRRLSRPDDVLDATTEILKVSGQKPSSNHDIIVRLSRDEAGRPSVVTTNFDTLFERALSRSRSRAVASEASTAGQNIPAPGTERFHGIIHLHGRLADTSLRLPATDLILTSAQYGEAYLRAGWAARFFFDLARCRTLVLVGYRAGDAPVRYILNVLEADRTRFTDLKTVYALDRAGDDTAAAAARWEALAVVPLLYKHEIDGGGHNALWRDLGALADLVERPNEWRKTTIQEVVSRPVAETSVAERESVQWAVRSRADLFGLFVDIVNDAEWFNVVRTELDAIGSHAMPWILARWFERGWSRLERWNTALAFVDVLRERLADEIDLSLLRTQPAEALWSRAWKLLAQSARERQHDRMRLHGIRQQIGRGVHEVELADLAGAVRPKLKIREPTMSDRLDQNAGRSRLSDIGVFRFDADSNLPVQEIVRAFQEQPSIAGRLCRIASEELIRALMSARDAELILGKRDATDWTVPSIADHEQNRHHGGFTPVIHLIRGLFDLWAVHESAGARALAEMWRQGGFRLPKRLWLYALSINGLFSADEAIQGLIDLEPDQFWSIRRESPLLIQLRAQDASPQLRQQLAERIVVEGAGLYNDPDSDGEDGWQAVARDREIWLRLKLLGGAGGLPVHAAAVLSEIENRRPHLHRDVEDMDFFSIYSTGVRSIVPNPAPLVAAAPEQRLRLADQLEESSDIDDRQSWAEYCRIDMTGALQSLTVAELEAQLFSRWRDWLNAIPYNPKSLDADQKNITRQLVQQAFGHLAQADAAAVFELGYPLAEAFIRSKELGARLAPDWWDRLWAAAEAKEPPEGADQGDLYDSVINSAGGRLTEYLLQKIDTDGRGKRRPVKRDTARLERLLASDTFAGTMGRGACARHLGFVFSVAPDVVDRHLLPRLNADGGEGERLRAVVVEINRFSPVATKALRDPILRGVRESKADGISATNVASQLVRPILARFSRPNDAGGGISDEDARNTLRLARPPVRAGAIEILERWLAEERPEQRARKWTEVFGPTFQAIWPRDRKYRSERVTRNVVDLALSSREAFPEAVKVVTPYVVPFQADWLDLHEFTREDHFVIRRFPDAALEILWACCKPPCAGRSTEISGILDVIVESAPHLEVDRRVQRLRLRAVT